MKDNYTYPVVLDYNEENIINIFIPNFENACTCVEKGEDYIKEAQDLLTLMIMDCEDNGKKLPIPSLDINIDDCQQVVYINVWMPYHRSKVKEVYVKKTLTIPSWLDILAKERNINFSSVLVKALKTELSLKQ